MPEDNDLKKIITILSLIPLFCFSAAESYLFTQKIKSTSGTDINLESYAGKSILIINIATRCGYTGQLSGIEEVFKKYKDKGLIIIGIPSNDFGGQTPEGDKKVVEFCRIKYGASFPISTKITVTGPDKHPLVKHLVKVSGGEEIKWNFEKFLFDKEGHFVSRFKSSVVPQSNAFIKSIESTLKLPLRGQ